MFRFLQRRRERIQRVARENYEAGRVSCEPKMGRLHQEIAHVDEMLAALAEAFEKDTLYARFGKKVSDLVARHLSEDHKLDKEGRIKVDDLMDGLIDQTLDLWYAEALSDESRGRQGVEQARALGERLLAEARILKSGRDEGNTGYATVLRSHFP